VRRSLSCPSSQSWSCAGHSDGHPDGHSDGHSQVTLLSQLTELVVRKERALTEEFVTEVVVLQVRVGI
jgi:hypothetical protein